MSKYCRVCNYCYVFDASDTCDRCKANYTVENEPKRTCPVDGTEMKKVQRETVVLDVCEKCNGLWVDGSEREMLKAQVQREGREQAHAQGMLIGMIIG